MSAAARRGGPAWLLVGAMAGALVAARPWTAGLCLAVAVGGAIGAGARWPSRRWWSVVGGGAAIAWLLNLFLVAGRPLDGLAIGPWAATREGLALGGLVALRLVGAAWALHGLRSAWPGERGADELARLLSPLEALRVPVARARATLGLALRFAPLLADESRRIARLQDLRAGRPPRGLGEWLARRRAATVPTLVHSLERAEQLALALEARHYRLRPTGGGTAAGGRAAGWGWAAAGAALVGVSLVERG